MAQKIKDCKTCKYYMPHFVIDNCSLMEIEGHCINDDLIHKYPYKQYRMHENCEYREEGDLIKEMEPSLLWRIKHIEKEVGDIAKILRYYEKSRSDRKAETRKNKSTP